MRKIMYTPVNPNFTIQKWSLRGSKLYRYVFVMIILEAMFCPIRGAPTVKKQIFYGSRCLFIANYIIFIRSDTHIRTVTHATHMRNVRNEYYAYVLISLRIFHEHTNNTIKAFKQHQFFFF